MQCAAYRTAVHAGEAATGRCGERRILGRVALWLGSSMERVMMQKHGTMQPPAHRMVPSKTLAAAILRSRGILSSAGYGASSLASARRKIFGEIPHQPRRYRQWQSSQLHSTEPLSPAWSGFRAGDKVDSRRSFARCRKCESSSRPRQSRSRPSAKPVNWCAFVCFSGESRSWVGNPACLVTAHPPLDTL